MHNSFLHIPFHSLCSFPSCILAHSYLSCSRNKSINCGFALISPSTSTYQLALKGRLMLLAVQGCPGYFFLMLE